MLTIQMKGINQSKGNMWNIENKTQMINSVLFSKQINDLSQELYKKIQTILFVQLQNETSGE